MIKSLCFSILEKHSEAFHEIRKMAESGELPDLALEEFNEEIRLARHNKATP